MKLGNIAGVRTGLVLSRKQAHNEKKSFHYEVMTLSAFDVNGELNRSKIDSFDSNERLDDNYLTKKGDVVIRLSVPNISVAIGDKDVGLLIPSQFAVIRGIKESLLPEYLSIYLNSKVGQNKMTKGRSGTVIQTISTTVLKDIEINIKPIMDQKQVVELTQLIIESQKLKERLYVLENQKQKYIIERLLKGEK